MKVVSVSQMKALEKRTVEELGTPGDVLMEKAGFGAGEIIIRYTGLLAKTHVKRFVLLAGKGNNGGDAYVVAKYLHWNTPKEVKIYAVCHRSELSGDAMKHAMTLPREVSCEVKTELTEADFSAGDIIIDGLLGTGINGNLRQPYSNWISTVNSLSLPVIALDIPSGLNADDGSISPAAVNADLTITMGLPKTGLLKGSGPDLSGMLRCVDIGIPSQYVEAAAKIFPDLVMASDAGKFFGRIPQNSHKASRGKLLVIGGSRDYPGAPFLTARAALRSGAGMVFLAIPDAVENIPWADSAIILRKVKSSKTSGTFNPESIDVINEMAQNCDAIVIGPGMTKRPETLSLMKYICSIDKPKLFDADALNMIAENPDIYVKSDKNVFTPHVGEMQRLLKGFGFDRLKDDEPFDQAAEFAYKKGLTLLLKGHRSIIVSHEGDIRVNSSGSPALATAGTGDVLSGIAGAFMAEGICIYDAVCMAAFIHGLAGEISPHGMRGTTADDLPMLIPDAMKEISPFA